MDSAVLLDQLLIGLRSVRLEERFIKPGDREWCVHGMWEGPGRIVINPIPHAVETLIHELCHERFPQWSEAYVQNRTSFLIHRLTEAQVFRIYNQYRRRVNQG